MSPPIVRIAGLNSQSAIDYLQASAEMGVDCKRPLSLLFSPAPFVGHLSAREPQLRQAQVAQPRRV
jgi:hypothetical protein